MRRLSPCSVVDRFWFVAVAVNELSSFTLKMDERRTLAVGPTAKQDTVSTLQRNARTSEKNIFRLICRRLSSSEKQSMLFSMTKGDAVGVGSSVVDLSLPRAFLVR